MGHAKQDRWQVPAGYGHYGSQNIYCQNIMHVDIAQEGTLIAADIMDSTESFHKLCAKCGESLFPNDKPRGTVKMSHGHCQPRKAFHYACVGEKFRAMIKYECQVCDPHNREEGCYSCGGPANANVVVCINNPKNRVPRILT